MSASLKIPLTANFAGRMWVGLLSFVATPLYVRWLGVEGFGLVGYYLLLQAIAGFFSGAVMDAANREVAVSLEPARQRPVIMGFSRVAWLAGLCLGVVFTAANHAVTTHWLSVGSLDLGSVRRSVFLMAALIALQLPLDFYVGALLGLRQHTAANVVFAGTATLRVLASVAALVFVTRSVEAFFCAQLGASLLMIVVGEWLLRRAMPAKIGPSISPWSCVRRSLRFSSGMTVIAVSGMVLSQADRIVLSRALPLDEFGVYSLATTLANLLYFLISPVRAAYYTEFARYVSPEQPSELATLYHSACHRMAAVTLPVAAILLFFARDLILVWTARADIAESAAPVVMFLVGARVISALNSLPYTLQFAHGWTGLVAKANVAAVVVLVPVLYWLASRYGATGAAAGYFVLSLPFLVLIVWRMHERLLPGELRRWIWADTMRPLLASVGAAAVCKLAEPVGLGISSRFAWIALSGLCTLGAVVWFSPALRLDARKLASQWSAR